MKKTGYDVRRANNGELCRQEGGFHFSPILHEAKKADPEKKRVEEVERGERKASAKRSWGNSAGLPKRWAHSGGEKVGWGGKRRQKKILPHIPTTKRSHWGNHEEEKEKADGREGTGGEKRPKNLFCGGPSITASRGVAT